MNIVIYVFVNLEMAVTRHKYMRSLWDFSQRTPGVTIMKVRLVLEVDKNDDGIVDTDAIISWNDCHWGDVTTIQRAVLNAMLKLNDLGFAMSIENQEMTAEMVEKIKSML
jgi:hypothetical protein